MFQYTSSATRSIGKMATCNVQAIDNVHHMIYTF
jgi:hypothetical protein